MECTYRLQGLLDLSVQSTGLQSDNLRGRIGVVGNGRATLGAEDAVDGVARATLARPGLGGAGDGQSGLGNDGDESLSGVSHCTLGTQVLERTVGRTTLALAVIAVVISGNDRRVDGRGVLDGAAETVTSERHDGKIFRGLILTRFSGGMGTLGKVGRGI